MMERRDNSRLPAWIIEHVWAHNMMDIQQVVDPQDWPDVDSQPLSVEDSWRLRVASARVFCIVKNRDVRHFEKVVSFLDATYRLLPRLVAPIKHMKILFGLKTMVVMRMLRERRGMVDTVCKISQFFPSKLPLYQDQCNQHQMFLMRKNNMEFRTLAQALAMDEDKLADYSENQMEKQYGEHYAQKVEDRLLHYLHQLEAALPGDTFVDKILKKQSPVTEEEKLLLDVITSDSVTIATTLRKLLHCDSASCRPRVVPPSSEHGETEERSSPLTRSGPRCSSSKAQSLESPDGKTLATPREFQAAQEVSGDVGRRHLTNEGGEEQEEETNGRSREGASSPQFCSKHQRWVESILQECPDECSEESSSPPLFPSSSSTSSSSQDLTPSDLVPCPSGQQRPPSQTGTRPPTAAAAPAPERSNPKDERSSGAASDGALPRPRSRDSLLPDLLSPVVRLIDIASVRRSLPTFTPHRAMKASASGPQRPTSPPHCCTSVNKDSSVDRLEIVAPTNPPNTTCTSPVSHDASATAGGQTRTRQSRSRLSRKHRRTRATSGRSPTTSSDLGVSGPSEQDASTSDPQSEASSSFSSNRIPSSPGSSPHVVPSDSIKDQPRTLNANTRPRSAAAASSSTFDSEHPAVVSDACAARPRLSLPCQAALLRSTLLQPHVGLSRLSARECDRLTEGRSSVGRLEPQGSDRDEDERNAEDDSDASFDVNILYSSHSSSGDCNDSANCDPDYKPSTKKNRRLSEDEAAWSLNHV
ncbi:flocculation protein FLO11 isoform X2 [Scophthalmus maximus]|uniref:flocculation protein FLO11 isoform X2 n=1 Tax=Scophthalmus maximus TaxID=52904 RepID=UPI001FA8E686|nr:flocculation protein FLO11 isoform X2 [Scophthalmus maximus]